MTSSVPRRRAALAGLFVLASAAFVLFGPLYGSDGGESVWAQGSVGRWIVVTAAAVALCALAAGAVGRRSIAVGLAWCALLVALVTATSVGALLMPALVVVLVMLLRPTPR